MLMCSEQDYYITNGINRQTGTDNLNWFGLLNWSYYSQVYLYIFSDNVLLDVVGDSSRLGMII